jgi:hypothetical protein
MFNKALLILSGAVSAMYLTGCGADEEKKVVEEPKATGNTTDVAKAETNTTAKTNATSRIR